MILGIAGSFGAGKGAVVEYLVKQRNFKHFSARDLLIKEIERLGLPVNRDSMIDVANDLRKQHGPSHIVEALYAHAVRAGGDVVIESLRAVAEVRKIKELGAIVVGVDADPMLRYERAVARKSETDNVSYEKWLEQHKRESNPEDATKQDVFGALKESDYIIQNNGSLEELHHEIERILEKINAPSLH